jgi:hypothetical protein
MSIPRILELRLSFVWTETFPALLVDTASNAPMSYLGSPQKYIQEYEKIRHRMDELKSQWEEGERELKIAYAAGSETLAKKTAELKETFRKELDDPSKPTPPWPWLWRNYIHHFWQYYFENKEPNRLTGEEAWNFVVPLRVSLPVQIGSPWPPSGPKWRAMFEGLFYQHGVAVILMPRLLFKQQSDNGEAAIGVKEPGLGLARTMERALQVRKEVNFSVTLPDGTQDSFKLDTVAAALLNYLRERVLGKSAPQGDRPNEPLTVATVIQGRGWNPAVPIAPQSDLHKVLEGLCTWEEDWATNQSLKPLTEANLLVSSSTPGHMVYHSTRGRAVWMPRFFASTSPRDGHKLSCYHRNLSLVSLHTEMLAQALMYYTDYLDRGEKAPKALESLARCAAIRIGYLYAALKKGSKKYTYNSASPRVYIQENDYKDIINQARQKFELSPLAYSPR